MGGSRNFQRGGGVYACRNFIKVRNRPFNYGEDGGLQNGRGASQVLTLQKRGWAKSFNRAEVGGGGHKKF